VTKNQDADIDEGSSCRVDVELFIVHPTLSPAEINGVLNMEAQVAHCVGDQRKTPKGTALDGWYHDTRWRYSIEYSLTDQWFADKITALVNSLGPHKAFLHHICTTGGRAQIIVQFLGDGYLGDSVPLSTLAKMAELQLDFGIECFVVPQS